jgi:hypothetical protein
MRMEARESEQNGPEIVTLPLVADPGLRALYAYWRALGARDGGLPRLQSFDPLNLPRLLPNIWVLEVAPDSHRFRMRLAGENINAIYGHNVGGHFFADIFDPADVPTIVQRYSRALCEPAIYHATGYVYAAAGRYSPGERLGLPMLGREGATNTLLGGTIYGGHMYDQGLPRITGDTPHFHTIRAANHRMVEIAGG